MKAESLGKKAAFIDLKGIPNIDGRTSLMNILADFKRFVRTSEIDQRAYY